jgi:hypothetical protein
MKDCEASTATANLIGKRKLTKREVPPAAWVEALKFWQSSNR